jgi:hypothetical protein
LIVSTTYVVKAEGQKNEETNYVGGGVKSVTELLSVNRYMPPFP